MNLRVLTYNIHKGFSIGNRKFILDRIKSSIISSQADLVHLQEVGGIHESSSQFEFLADQTWPHFAYGKNAIYTRGHHGNAILSKYPIVSFENQDISLNRFEKRGLLHAKIQLDQLEVHALTVHLNLLEKDRSYQIEALCERIHSTVPKDAALILAGDFNDWRQVVSSELSKSLGLKEAFLELNQSHAKTFPSFYPLLPLDRIYYRNLQCVAVNILKGGSWNEISDHLPILAEFQKIHEKNLGRLS